MRRIYLAVGILTISSFLSTVSVKSLKSPMEDDHTCLQVPSKWLPTTPLPAFGKPAPHPAPDCPFYQAAWQTFLYATQPDSDGRPRFLSSYATIKDLFGPNAGPEFAKEGNTLGLAPRTIELANEKTDRPNINAGVSQAGLKGVLIDQNGNPIYYAIHVNDVFAKFLKDNGLTTKDALVNADPDKLEFPKGSVELKSAWQIVEDDTPSNYFTTKAVVPVLRVQDGNLIETNATRPVKVALIAIHVVFVLDGHPEFIWSTFEHHLVTADHTLRDNAPAASANPDGMLPVTVISNSNWPLFKGGTNAGGANFAPSAQDTANSFDEKAQKFKKGMQTSVYRAFPTSKSQWPNTKCKDLEEDGDIVDVNSVMRKLFASAQLDTKDKRGNYELVGAVWLDNPGDFKSNMFFQNPDGQCADDGMVAGEDRLSSTAMESFTQIESPNCFGCHNTKKVTADITHKLLVGPKRLNVSHVMSKYLAELP